MKTARIAALLFIAIPLAADPIGDVRAAVGKLTAREPVRATYEYQRTVKNEGKFGDSNFAGKATVELEANDSGYHIVFSKALLDQVDREKTARVKNPEQETPTANALREIEPVETADALDFVPTLLRLLDGSKLVSDGNGTWAGKPARVMVIRVPDRLSKDDAGKMKVGENRLTLWLGSDLVPLAAEHLFNAKVSFLIFKAEVKEKKSWHLSRVADRLVRTRYEATQNSSGMGQKGNESVVATLRIH